MDRTQIVELITKYLGADGKNGDTATRIERSCYNRAIGVANGRGIIPMLNSEVFHGIYSDVCYEVLANLDTKGQVGSTYLRDAITSGAIEPRDVGGLTPYDMCPAVTQGERDVIDERSRQKVNEKFTDTYRCPICKARRATLEERQLLSIDEASTWILTCLECNHKWTRSGG